MLLLLDCPMNVVCESIDVAAFLTNGLLSIWRTENGKRKARRHYSSFRFGGKWRFVIARIDCSTCNLTCDARMFSAHCGILVNVTPFEPECEGYVTLEFSNTTPLRATKVDPLRRCGMSERGDSVWSLDDAELSFIRI